MSQFYEYNWPTPIPDGVAVGQYATSSKRLILNGHYANKTTGIVDFTSVGIVPRITLTSDKDFSTVPFSIQGYQNGVAINETLTGPNNATVTSVNCFDRIDAVIPLNTVAENIKVGVASTGYFPIILLNTAKNNVSKLNYALNIVAAAANPATYQVFLSLKNNLGLGKYDDLTKKENGNFVAIGVSDTKSQLIPYDSLAQNLLIQVNKNDSGSILKAQFLQL